MLDRIGSRDASGFVGAGVRPDRRSRETGGSRWRPAASPGSPAASWAQSRRRRRWRRLRWPASTGVRASGGAVEAHTRRLAARRTVLGLPLVISAVRRSYSATPDVADNDVDQPAEDRACPPKIQVTRLPGRSARSRDQPRARRRARVAPGWWHSSRLRSPTRPCGWWRGPAASRWVASSVSCAAPRRFSCSRAHWC